MEWKTITHLSNDVEISNLGMVRYVDEKTTIHVNYNLNTHYYDCNIIVNNNGSYRSLRKNIHILVARYFLNEGNPIDHRQKVIFKDGDKANYASSNLAIVDRYDGEYRDNAPKMRKRYPEEVFINYGDEIYC